MATQTPSAVKPPQQAQPRPPVRPPVQNPPPPSGSQSFNSLFIPAAEVQTFLKVVFYGAPGVGKTPLSLSFPDPAVIDVEGLAKIYARSFPKARFMPADSLATVKAGILAAKADGGRSFKTLVIDSLTPVYDERKMYYLEKFGYLDQPQWSRINTEMKDLYRLLADCPFHTVVIGREAVLYEEGQPNKSGRKELKAVGTRMDLDKAAGYQPNILIHVTGNKGGTVIKVQGLEMPMGTPVSDLTWGAFFEPIAQSLATGDNPDDITTGVGKSLFLAFWNGRGLKNSQIMQALGIKAATDWTAGRAAADGKIEAAAIAHGWLAADEPDEPSAPAGNAPRMSPMGGQLNPPDENPLITQLADVLVPNPYKTVARLTDTLNSLIASGALTPDEDFDSLAQYLYTEADSE